MLPFYYVEYIYLVETQSTPPFASLSLGVYFRFPPKTSFPEFANESLE